MCNEYENAPFSVEYLKTLQFRRRQTHERRTDYGTFVGDLRYTVTDYDAFVRDLRYTVTVVYVQSEKPYAYATLIADDPKVVSCDGPELTLTITEANELLGGII